MVGKQGYCLRLHRQNREWIGRVSPNENCLRCEGSKQQGHCCQLLTTTWRYPGRLNGCGSSRSRTTSSSTSLGRASVAISAHVYTTSAAFILTTPTLCWEVSARCFKNQWCMFGIMWRKTYLQQKLTWEKKGGKVWIYQNINNRQWMHKKNEIHGLHEATIWSIRTYMIGSWSIENWDKKKHCYRSIYVNCRSRSHCLHGAAIWLIKTYMIGNGSI